MAWRRCLTGAALAAPAAGSRLFTTSTSSSAAGAGAAAAAAAAVQKDGAAVAGPVAAVAVFDLYGTLVDFHSAVARHSLRFSSPAEAAAVSAAWRSKQLEYTWLRTLMGDYTSFWNVTKDALDYAFAHCGVSDSDPGLKDDLMDAYNALESFGDVPAALKDLQTAGVKTAILSNGDSAMVDAAVESAKLGGVLDAVLSVDAKELYKPNPDVYQLSCDRFDVQPKEIMFMSANYWDVVGATSFGHSTVWVNRAGLPWNDRLGFLPGATLPSLEPLPALLRRGHPVT